VAAQLLSSPALADDDTSRAREAFQEGIALESGGKHADALKRFREVAAVKKTPQVLFHIALCQEKIGQLAEALDGYRVAGQLAGSDPKLADVRRTIEESMRNLDAQVPAVQVKRGKGARNAILVVDGQRVELEPNTPLRLNPGRHTFVGKAKNKDNYRAELTLQPGDRASITIKLDDLGIEDDPIEPEPDKAQKPASEGRVAPYVLGAVGLAGFAAAGGFFLLRQSARSDLEARCIDTVCPASAQATGDRAASMNRLTNLSLGLGAVAMGAAVVVLLVGGDDARPAPASARWSTAPGGLRLRLDAGPAPLGAGLTGSF
jgi:tetratricopeptide (TPR) repeat protein